MKFTHLNTSGILAKRERPLFALWLSNESQYLNPNLGFPVRRVWDLRAETETNYGIDKLCCVCF